MNRLSLRIAAWGITLVLLASTPLQAANRQPKKKKNQDLSANPLANSNSKQPDKELYDKAMRALKKGRYDVARLDLQTLLNTYPNSEYQMRAKLAVGDTWFKEGGTAALTQAEAEYKDFETFFPQAPEAAEAQMKVADIYYQQMGKPDRDYTNVMRAEQEYRNMINQYPDSSLIPRAKQQLRQVQEVMAERETEIGLFYASRFSWPAALARLQTVADTYPLYSKSDQVLLAIGDSYAGEAQTIQNAVTMPAAIRERLHAIYQDRAVQAYARIITRYPMAAHVEDARDRLVQMNRPIPEPTQAQIAENDAEERSRQPVRFTSKTWGIIKHSPQTVEAAHVGEPTMVAPKRILAPAINKENAALFTTAVNGSNPAIKTAAIPTGANEPPRSDQPSTVPLQFENVEGTGNNVGVTIVSAPGESKPAPDPNAVIKPVGAASVTPPPVEKPAEAPEQTNEVKSNATPLDTAANVGKRKAPKADLSDESSSRKKKKKGLSRLKPF